MRVLMVLLVLVGSGYLLAGCNKSGSGHMLGGGMMGGGMMGQTAENNGSQPLPDQQSKQAQLYKHYCSQCHALPSPRAHTAQEWPSVVARMKQTMTTQGKMPPDNEQLEEILGYLQRYAK